MLIAAALFFALQSCQNQGQSVNNPSNNATNNTAAATNALSFVKKEFKADKEGQTASYSIDIAQGDSPQAQFINNSIFRSLQGTEANISKNNLNYQELANSFVTDAIAYQKEDPSGDWSSDNTAVVYYNSPNFISVVTSGWEYAGGAHGNPWANALYLDPAKLQMLMIKDIIGDEMALRKLISPLLDKELKKTGEYDASYLEIFADNGLVRLPACVYFSSTEAFFDFSHQELFDAGMSNAISTLVKIPIAQVQPFLKLKL